MGQLDGRGISVPLMGGEVGRASAIKMCYASLSKGAAALNASALISAMNLGIYDEFIAEMESSQQGVLSNMQGVKSLGAKAFRWDRRDGADISHVRSRRGDPLHAQRRRRHFQAREFIADRPREAGDGGHLADVASDGGVVGGDRRLSKVFEPQG